MQQSMASSFEVLMKDIGRNLSAKNRDKYANILVHSKVMNCLNRFTQNLSVFRRDVWSCMKDVMAPTSTVTSDNMMT